MILIDIFGAYNTLVMEFIWELFRYAVSLGAIVLAIYLGAKLRKRHDKKAAIKEMNEKSFATASDIKTSDTK